MKEGHLREAQKKTFSIHPKMSRQYQKLTFQYPVEWQPYMPHSKDNQALKTDEFGSSQKDRAL